LTYLKAKCKLVLKNLIIQRKKQKIIQTKLISNWMIYIQKSR